MLSKGNGSSSWNSKLSGRHVTCGTIASPSRDELPRTARADRGASRGRACPASSAVHVIGRPVLARDRGELVEEAARGRSVACMMPWPASPSVAASGSDLVELGGAARHRSAGVADVRAATSRWRSRARRRRAPARTMRRIARDLVVGRRALGGLLAHDVEPHRRVTDERADVDRHAAPLDGVEVLAGRSRTASRRRARRRAASMLMPSTFSSVRRMSSRCCGRVGATPKPQLPITTVVTPCHGEIVSMRSQKICAS